VAFFDFFKGLFNKENKQLQHFRMLDGGLPIFSQFGQNIYASDVVLNCIDIIASEISKLTPQHIFTGPSGSQQIPKSSINRLFLNRPNLLMSTKEFLEKVIWLLYNNYNCFIYPVYELVTDSRGYTSRYYTGFYPLNPTRVDFLLDPSGTLFCKLTFPNNDNFTIPYTDLIHIRKMYSFNEIMGGGANGQPPNEALLKVLEINHTVLQGLPKAIKSSLSIRGIMKINTMLDDDKQRAERDRLEAAINSGLSGIIPMDLKGEYTPVAVDPKMVDKDTMDFLQNNILCRFGVSVPIYVGDYSDDQYQAFYEKTLEPIIIALGQAFSWGLFTQREVDVGNSIVFYQKDLNYLSTASKLNLIKTMGEQGLLTDDQKLAILGYPPLADGTGNRRTMSLNYIDVTLANEYQMNRANAPQINAQGGNASGQ
jgi:HK97 family phage portal protein